MSAPKFRNPEDGSEVPGTWVKGTIVSSTLALAEAMSRIERRIVGAGWQLQSYNVDTSTGLFGVMPKERAVNAKLHRATPYAPAEAAAAVLSACQAEGWDLDLVGSYLSEVNAELVQPTLADTGKAIGGAVGTVLDKTTEGMGLPSWVWKVGLGVAGLGVAAYFLSQLRAFVPRKGGAA